MDNLHWTEVDGITTVWAEAPEPLRAGLMFRTGLADETLITAGHTHLIEHMAMAKMSDFTQSSNGFVSGAFTSFVTQGRPEDVCAFFRKLFAGLASLPADRLEAEKKILLAEAAGRQYDVSKILLIWRYGAAGYGLCGQPELGIRGATMEQLQAWKQQRFTRGNAILWLSGPMPTDLHLDLPPGEKQPMPQLAPIQGTFPSWFVDDRCRGVAASATVPRLAEGSIFQGIAAKRMREALRNKQAVSYSPWIFYEPLNAEIAHLVLFADSEPDRRAELANAFGEVFEKLTVVGESEVEASRKLYLDQVTGPLAPSIADRPAIEAQRAAYDWLFGQPHETLDQLAEEACLVRADEVMAFGQDMRNTTMFAVPGGVTIAPWMGEGAPASSGKVVKGREIPHADSPVQTERLVVGSEGVSVQYDDFSHITVRYASLAAALHYDDGGMWLVGSDSTWLRIEPTLWRTGTRVVEEILGKIPAHLILEQGPRDKDAIPRPSTTTWQRWMRLFGLDKQSANRSSASMGKSTRRNAYIFLGVRAMSDLALVAALYQQYGNRGQAGMILIGFIFYFFMFNAIKNETIYGDRFAYSRFPAAYWLVFGGLVLIHMIFMLWMTVKLFS